MESQAMMRYARFDDDMIPHLSVGRLLDAYIASFKDVEGINPSVITLHPLVWDKLCREEPSGDTEIDGLRRYYKGYSVKLNVGQYKIGVE